VIVSLAVSRDVGPWGKLCGWPSVTSFPFGALASPIVSLTLGAGIC